MRLLPRRFSNFFKRTARNIFQRNPVMVSVFPSWMKGWASGTEKDLKTYANEGYRKNAIAHSCIRVLADSTSEPELVVYSLDADDERIMRGAKDPLVTLLDHPNPEQTQYELLREMVIHQYVFGGYYLHKVRSRAGRPVQLWLLNPTRVKIIPGSDGAIEFYRYGMDGKYVDIPAADVIYQKFVDPLDDFYPLSPISVMARQGDLDNQAVDYLNAFFLNAGTPAGLLKFKMQVPKEERERVKLQWKDEHSGPGGWHTVDVLDADCEYQTTGTDPQRLELQAIFGHTESRIAATFGVPLIIIGSYLGLMRCLPADSRVWCRNGPRPISDIKSGDQVWSFVDGHLELRSVVSSSKTGRKKLLEIRTRNRIIRASVNHPILTRITGGSHLSNNERKVRTEWIAAEKLRVGDYIVQPHGIPDLRGDQLPDGGVATVEMMQWLGAFVGDGCFTGGDRDVGLTLCFPKTDRVRKQYEDLTAKLFSKQIAGWLSYGKRATDNITDRIVKAIQSGGSYTSIGQQVNLSAASVRDRYLTVTLPKTPVTVPCFIQEARHGFRFSSTLASKRVRSFGFKRGARNKAIPGWIFELSRELRLAFIAGLIDSDGSVDKRGSMSYCSASKQLCEDLKDLLLSVGIRTSNVQSRTQGPSKLLLEQGSSPQSKFPYYTLTASAAAQISEIPFFDSLYRQRVDGNLSRYREAGFDAADAGLSNDLGFYLIRSIKELGGEEDVYDIEVRDGHSFIADGIVVHNSTLSNIGAAQKVLWQNTLVPLYTWTADKLTEGLAREFDQNLYIDFDLTDVEALQESKKEVRDFALRAWDTGLVTRNKALEMVGEVPVADGDVYKTSTATVYTAAGEQVPSSLPEAAARRLVGRRIVGDNIFLLPSATEAQSKNDDPPMTRVADAYVPRLRKRFFASSGRCATALRSRN